MYGGGYGRSNWIKRLLRLPAIAAQAFTRLPAWGKITIGVVLGILVLSMVSPRLPQVGRYTSPKATVRQFLLTLNRGRDDLAIDFICPGPVVVMPDLGQNFLADYSLTTLSNYHGIAEVRVLSEFKLVRPEGTIKVFPKMDLTLYREGGQWCIDGVTIVEELVKWISTDIEALIETLDEMLESNGW